MKKAAVLVAPGCEEGETLTIVDIIRRANIECTMFGASDEVIGGHDIVIKCDNIISNLILDYDMVILPGGYGGATYFRDSEQVISILQKMNENNKYVCAMCASPIALEKANLLEGKQYTAYKGYDQKIHQGTYLEDKYVIDGNIVTGRGPATTYAFAYKLVELLGGDSLAIKKRMLYFSAFDVKEDE